MGSGDKKKVPVSVGVATATGIGGLIAIFAFQTIIASLSPDAWWFFVTAVTAAILADIITAISERAYRDRREQWVFTIKFAFFVEAMIAGTILGELAKTVIKITLFDISQPVGFFTFWGLNAFVPVFLFLDFYLKSKYRVVRDSQS